MYASLSGYVSHDSVPQFADPIGADQVQSECVGSRPESNSQKAPLGQHTPEKLEFSKSPSTDM